MRFFVGLHQPSDASRFDLSFVSVTRLRKRKGPFEVGDWIMDSGAFTEVARHGGYRHSVEEYADQIRRWRNNGNLLAAVAQDYMCEKFVLDKTGLTVKDHQRMTIERYDALKRCETECYIMPVLQGYAPESYVDHIHMYGERLMHGMWVGVGSICKRNGNPSAVAAVLLAIKRERPDLRLHGFGLKTTSLADPIIRELLDSADSMAWSFSARRQGRDPNDWREAKRFELDIVGEKEKTMATRGSALQRALKYFREADTDEMRVAFTLAKEIVERRLAQATQVAPNVMKTKRTRKPRTQAAVAAPTNGGETLADA